MVLEMLVRAGIESTCMYGSACFSMIVRMTLNCMGVSVITPAVLGKELASGALHLVRVKTDPLPELSFTAA